MPLVPCEKCAQNRYCPKKGEFNRLALFSHAEGKQIECKEYEPRWFRGIEGVAA